jgi:tetratricopeptide (TPR) repeat protein
VLLTARHEPASPQVRLVPLDVLDQESAVALFAERYADRGGAWEGNRDGAPAAAAVEALGRLPLAIELAAARAARARTGVAALAAELGEADRLGKLRDPLDRTRSVRYAFSRGLDLLTPLQRARFAALGLPDGPDWPRPLIERLLDAVRDDVLNVVPTPAGEADPAGDDLDVLAALALVNLAAPTPSGGPAPRVRLHPLLRELAREEWGAQPEEVRAACLGALLGAVDDLIWGAGRDFGAITREEDLIAGTLRRASQARLDPPRVLATVDALEPYLDSGGHWRLGVELSTLQLTAGRMAGDRAHEGKALNNLGYLAHRLGSTDEAAHYYARALAVRREIGDRAGEGETLNNLGGLARLQGHFEEAMRDYEQALALRREIGDRRGEGTTLHNLGTLAGDLGRPDDAARYYAQALVARREAGDPRGEGITLNNLGGLAEGLGRRAEAAGHYERALALLREVGDRAGEATALNNLGNLARAEGRAEEAEGFYEQALLIRREIGDRRGQSTTLNNLGVLAESRGRREEAAHAFERALDIERELGDRGGEAASLSNLGMLANARGRQDEARNLLDQALTIQREIRDRAGQGVVLNSLGALARAQGRHDEAARDFEEALAIQRETDDRAGEGITLNNLGLLAYARGRQDDAARDFERAIALLDATGASDAARTARDNLAALPSSARVGGVTHAGEAAAPPVGTPMPTVSAPAPMDGAVPTHGFAAPLEAPATRMPLTAPAPDAPPAPKPSATPEPRKRRRWWPFGR